MTEHTDDIKKTIRIAKAIENDIREYKSFDVQAAYQKNRKRLDGESTFLLSIYRELQPFCCCP